MTETSTPTTDRQGNTYFRNADGDLHRDGDQPARIWADGTKEWWRMGNRHRDNGQPAIIWSEGRKEWWVNGVSQPKPPS